ncbi:uncharacterized protein LOC123346681 [Mauremys mutica]|uniref:uncharacterized protein LOC123346681 n=1 Tax=Mauremys mutica TaxID=74926 RepID=UPI001D16DD7E|nr:uncharacterized protein LOC123346681 [Mauremys mutica]
MATDNPVESLQEEATCPICLEYFKDPVIIDCGHHFCRACIAQCWEGSNTDVSCPQCRETVQQGNLRPNRKLANVVEMVKRLSLQAAKGAGEERVCGEHQETLKLFCEEDQTSVCVVCHLSRAHREHRVIPIKEAAQEYKGTFYTMAGVNNHCFAGCKGCFSASCLSLAPAGSLPPSLLPCSSTAGVSPNSSPGALSSSCSSSLGPWAEGRRELEGSEKREKEKLQGALGPLTKELEEALALMSAEEKKTTEWQGKVKNRREMIAGEFNKLHTLLREEEQLLLQSLEEEESETLQKLQENVTKLSQQSSSLQQLITELEEKCQQPVVELLKDVKSTLSRSENVKLQEPEAVSTHLKNVYKISLDMGEALKRFGVDVTLDPDTASPGLVLSEDRKRVRLGDKRQDLPNNPERFDTYPEVLGAEGFAGGRRYWEVEVGDKPGWELGVCRESVSRKGESTFSPGNGFWVVWLEEGEYKAGTSPMTPVPVSVRPSRVGIFLDYEAGEVSFYNVTDRSHLFTFTDTFSGKLRPYFCPGLNAGGTNAAPLIICPVPAQAGGNLGPAKWDTGIGSSLVYCSLQDSPVAAAGAAPYTHFMRPGSVSPGPRAVTRGVSHCSSAQLSSGPAGNRRKETPQLQPNKLLCSQESETKLQRLFPVCRGAMAAGDLAGSFQDEVTCSVCLEYFTDPVTIECGHNFCRACISQCWGESESNFSCPQCRETALQRNLRPNRQLGNLVELVKRLRLQAVTEPEGQRMCERHQEALKLFCEEDQTPICVVCDRSRAHRAHTVVPIEEAAQEYREQILSRLQHLQEEREELLGLKSDWDKESERLLRQTEVERQLVVFECEQLRQFLAEQERLLLARLGELDQEIGRRREENATRLCEEISQLSALITELEGKCQQPVPELLQGVRSAVRRGEKVMSPHPAPKSPELEKRIRDFPRENKLQEAVTGFLEGLAAERGLRRARGFAVDVTLDPDTANPNLVLSEDRKHVRHGDEEQALPDNPERFDTYPEVLGTEGFTGGRHYWEVEVGDKPDWMLGVCRDSVIRKGENDVSLEDGYWVVQLADGKYEGLTSPTTPLPVSVRPSRVGIFLDYEAGEVSFYNVTDRSHLYTFTGTFHGKLRPYFYPGLNAGGTKTAPLIICPVSAQAEGNLCP